ncbi:MAG: hypothetical protein H6618_09155 [Deltaproteobacteria bacterium]|nr:hypothetical protein [Deltaproteobacteria bacterium]
MYRDTVRVSSLVAFMIITFISLTGCGSDDKDETSSTTTTYKFSTDISSILSGSCASNGICHASDNAVGNVAYVGNKDNLVAHKTDVINRMNGTGSLMPPADSGVSLSTADKQKLEDYLNQSTHD